MCDTQHGAGAMECAGKCYAHKQSELLIHHQKGNFPIDSKGHGVPATATNIQTKRAHVRRAETEFMREPTTILFVYDCVYV